MKRSLGQTWLLASLLMSLVGAAAIFPPIPVSVTVPIVLSFDYPTNAMDTNLVFVLRGTNQLGLSPTNWPIEQSLFATNYWTNAWTLPVTGTNYTVTFTNQTTPGVHFWYVAATNFWGESLPSNVLEIPPLPTSTLNLKAQRGW